MTPQDLKDGICQRLAELWPDRTVYPDVCPDDHERPSSYVQVLESTPTMVNAHLVRWDAKLLVTIWGDLDDYSLAGSAALMADQKAVTSALFPFLAVGDRVVALSVSDQGRDESDGAAFVEASCCWYDGLDSLKDPESGGATNPNLPLMRDFHGKIHNKKGAEENG